MWKMCHCMLPHIPAVNAEYVVGEQVLTRTYVHSKVSEFLMVMLPHEVSILALVFSGKTSNNFTYGSTPGYKESFK